MAEKEKAYKVTGRLTIDYELIVQALNADESQIGSFAKHIWGKLMTILKWGKLTTIPRDEKLRIT